jgi:hypothetical protein
MKKIIEELQKIKKKTGAKTVAIGNNNETENGYILILIKDGFEQHNKMRIGTQNTVDSISASFLQSYSDYINSLEV